MKPGPSLFIFIIFYVLIEVSSVIHLQNYDSPANPLNTGGYLDILEIPVKCKNKGVIKNFELRKNSTHAWYNYNCYSSLTEANEYDESILKALNSSYTKTFKYKISESIESLKRINFVCPVDYALNQFLLYKNEKEYLVMEYTCIGVKSSYQTKDNSIASSSSEGNPLTLDPLIGLTCGDNTIETENFPGTPLKGFEISTLLQSGRITVTYKYSYHKLRSIELEKKQWAEQTKLLRESNTQLG